MDTDGSRSRTWVGGLAEKGYRRGKEEMIARFRGRVVEKLDSHKNRAADLLAALAGALRRAAEQPTDQRHVAEMGASAAVKVEDFSRYIRRTEVEEIARSLERAARKRPALLFGGSFVIGFLFARYLTNSQRGTTGELKRIYASGP